MPRLRLQQGLFACVVLGLLGTPAAAQEVVDRSDFQQLYRRLQQAEARIEQLEGQQSDSIQLSGHDGDTAAQSASASNSAVNTRLSKLERAWKDFSAANADDKPATTLKVFGRIHLDQWGYSHTSDGVDAFEGLGDDVEDRVFFRRLRIGVRGDVRDNMEYKFEFDFGDPGDPNFKDAYFGWNNLPILQTVLLGNQKRPIGLDHLNSSRYNVFLERPLVIEAFNQDARRVGICSYGLTDDLLYHWRYGVFLQEDVSGDGTYRGDSLQGQFVGRLSSTPWYDEQSGGRGYFHWAVSGSVARPDGDNLGGPETNRNEARFRTRSEVRSQARWLNTGRIAGAEWFEQVGLEAALNIGAFSLVGEYQNTTVQRDAHTPGTGPDVFFHGAYVYAAWFLTGEHQPWDRTDGTLDRVHPLENFFLVDGWDDGVDGGWGAWQIALRLSYLDLTDEDITGGEEDNLSLGLNWWWNSHSRVQFNYIWGDIMDRGPVDGFTRGNFHGWGTRFMVDY